MKLFFCGTPQFAVPSLERLLASEFTVDLVLTNPDEPQGRGYECQPPPVKKVASRAGLTILQPHRLKDPALMPFLRRFHPDAIVVVAYGHLIPPWMIAWPRLGCINVHASLLPKYRGAAPIAWALINGESTTGVTTMKLDAGLDTGDILLQQEEAISPDDTAQTLSDRLSLLGAELLVETLRRLNQGAIEAKPQDQAQATLAPLLKKEHGIIDWTRPAKEIWRRVRGLQPWPGAFTTFRGRNLHIWSAEVAAETTSPSPPGLLCAEQGRLLVACGEGTRLEIKELQLEGRKRLSARAFLNGVRLQPHERLGP